MAETKKPFHAIVAEKLIEQLKQGTAPWQKPWKVGQSGAVMPHNPNTGKRYRGINAIYLMSQGYPDQRWMTYKQALDTGGQVRKGEKGTMIQYWKFSEEKSQTGADGKPVLSTDGAPLRKTVRLERPRVFFATVFNAGQIDGLPLLPAHKEQEWHAVERAEQILQSSGAVIHHAAQNRAFYRVDTDSIHLPEKSCFSSADNYYATALHELGHWSGHASRLDRDLAHPFGSEGYAREELRAEIASMILGDELGIGHDPKQHAAYVGTWVKVLQDDPLEIFRAAADAEKIQGHVLGLEHRQIEKLAQTHQQAASLVTQSGSDVQRKHADDERVQLAVPAARSKGEQEMVKPVNLTHDRHYLAVPYGERAVAKMAGAVWDKAARSWYVGPQADMTKLARWKLDPIPGQEPALRPKDEFAEALRFLGCVVDGAHPLMDGRKHRITVEGEKHSDKAGSGVYVGHLDGHPAGYIKNYKTGIGMTWKSKGYMLDPQQKAQLQAEAAAKLQERETMKAILHEQAALRVVRQMANLVPAVPPTPYMRAKGIAVQPGVFTDQEGRTTYLPAMDADGKQWTMQYIGDDGTKRFAKDSRKGGCFHVIHGMDRLVKAPALVIAEGFATASSLSQALGFATVAAFDSGNLPHVAKALHAKFPDKPVIVAGDDDRHLEASQGVNPGKSKAEEAARATGGTVLLPIFAPGEQAQNPKGFTDFNDLALKSALGKEGIERQVRSAVDAIVEKHQATIHQQMHLQQERKPGRPAKIG